MKNYGGNLVEGVTFDAKVPFVFNDNPYYYALHVATSAEPLRVPKLEALSIFLLELEQSCSVNVAELSMSLAQGDTIQSHHSQISVCVLGDGQATFLIAGVARSEQTKSCKVVQNSDIKKVIKPWGHELWISGEHPDYALKQVFVRSPTKTSLQYHNHKHETIVIFNGTANLHYKKSSETSNELAEIDTILLDPVTMVNIVPPVLHRFEALSDLTMYEASTPHLHDVIRVSDDTNRPDGKIVSEHQ